MKTEKGITVLVLTIVLIMLMIITAISIKSFENNKNEINALKKESDILIDKKNVGENHIDILYEDIEKRN